MQHKEIMSVNVARVCDTLYLRQEKARIQSRKGGRTVKGKNILSLAVKNLLSEKLPEEKAEALKNEGFKLKSPTRKAALAIALYKKAESGDLSAIKELRSILSDAEESSGTKAVVIIDDTQKADF